MFDLESQIRQWSDRLRETGKFTGEQIAELESHLRDQIEELVKKELTQEEACIIAMKRIGDSELLSQEFGKVNKDTLWKKLAFYETDNNRGKKLTHDIFFIVILCLVAGTLARIPVMLGLVNLVNAKEYQGLLYLRNIGFFFMPCIICYLTVRRFYSWLQTLLITGIFAAAAVLINLYPIREPFHTATFTAIHLFILLWLVTGVAYAGSRWKESGRRMDFIRYSGEVFIYSVLLGCGVVVLSMFTFMIFGQIEIEIKDFFGTYIIQYLLFAIPITAAYLVEAKKSIIENIAPILANIFSPLFLLTMLIFLGAVVFFKANPWYDREFLIMCNAMLVLVLGLVLYSLSARKPQQQITLFDWINLALIITAIIIDGIALSAILFRITSFGLTSNKLTTLGINLLLMVNLTGLAVCRVLSFMKQERAHMLEKWQGTYLYVYAGWSLVVSFLFPVLFNFQ